MSKRTTAAATISRERMYDVIRAPVVTEKSTLGSVHGQVSFKVAPDATKPEIKAAVEGLFGVRVERVNTINQEGKRKVFRGRPGRRNGYKKAIVTLVEGETIDVTTGV